MRSLINGVCESGYILAEQLNVNHSWSDLLHHISDEVIFVPEAIWIILMAWRTHGKQRFKLNQYGTGNKLYKMKPNYRDNSDYLFQNWIMDWVRVSVKLCNRVLSANVSKLPSLFIYLFIHSVHPRLLKQGLLLFS